MKPSLPYRPYLPYLAGAGAAGEAPAITLVSITVTPDAGTIVDGATQQFTATGTYSDASTADITATVTWDSSSDALATITAGGLATGVSYGQATISATLGAISDTTTLDVWSPMALFAADEDGAWYDPSDFSSLFQDSAATTPVTATGQSVAYIADKSGNGYHMAQTDGAKVGTLRQNALGKYYVEFLSGDAINSAANFTLTIPSFGAAALGTPGNSVYPRFGISKATNQNFGIGALFPTANAQFGTTDSVEGNDKVTTALASLSPANLPFVCSGHSLDGSTKIRVNGGTQWSAASSLTNAFTMATTRVQINTTNGQTTATSVTHFYGGLIVNRTVTTEEEALVNACHKEKCGISALEAGTWDIFAIAGQSNGTGQGDSATAGVVPLGNGIEYQQEGCIKPLADPGRHYSNPGSATGAVSQTGSCWPAFANAYLAETGRKACLVGGTSSGIGLTTAAGWDVATTYVDFLSAKALAAHDFIEAAGGTATIKGVVWVGGESDAVAGVAEATFEAGLASLLGKLKTAFGDANLKMFMLSVDQSTDSGQDAAFATIRQAQIDAAAATTDLYLVMPYQEFEVNSMLEDTIHWNQTALNSAGAIAGAAVADLLP